MYVFVCFVYGFVLANGCVDRLMVVLQAMLWFWVVFEFVCFWCSTGFLCFWTWFQVLNFGIWGWTCETDASFFLVLKLRGFSLYLFSSISLLNCLVLDYIFFCFFCLSLNLPMLLYLSSLSKSTVKIFIWLLLCFVLKGPWEMMT